MATVISTFELAKTLNSQPSLYAWIEGEGQLVLGRTLGTPTHSFDFGKEELVPYRQNSSRQVPLPRSSGEYSATVLDETKEFRRLSDLLKWVLLSLKNQEPTLFDELENIVPRSKRIVARKKEDLFTNKPELAQKHSWKIGDSHWMNTNNSSGEVSKWIERATELSGLEMGSDVRLKLT